ncbi:hypothetical protein D3C72_1112240 [compost metagenome]
MRRHGKPGGGNTGFGPLVVGDGGFALALQAAEQIDLPAGIQAQLVIVAVAVVVGRGVQQLALRRLQGLARTGGLARHGGRGQHRGGGAAQTRARLGHARHGLRNVQVLVERALHQLGQQRIVKPLPPDPGISRGRRLTRLDRGLSHKMRG